MIGGETVEIESTQAPVVGMNASVLVPERRDLAYDAHVHTTRFFYYPQLSIEAREPMPLVVRRAGVGYVGYADAEWEDQNGSSVASMPDITTDGITVQFAANIDLAWVFYLVFALH